MGASRWAESCARWVCGVLLGLSALGVASAQESEWRERADEALQAGDGAVLAALWAELQGASNKQARKEFLAWRDDGYREWTQEPDGARQLALSQALWPVFSRPDESRYQEALIGHRDYWIDIPISEALDAEDFTLTLDLIDRAARNLNEELPENATLCGRLNFYRARVYRDLGLIDRAFDLKDELEQERLRLGELALQNPTDLRAAALSQLTLLLAWLDLAEHDYGKLRGWLGDVIGSGQLVIESQLEARYLHAIAVFEVDREDRTGAEQALAELSALVDDFAALDESDFDYGVPYLLLSQAHLRWARIAMHLDDLSTAEAQLALAKQAAHNLEESSAKEEAHRLVFEVRLARRLGRGLEAAQAALLREWEGVLDTWRNAPLRPGGLGYLTFDNHRRTLAEVLRVQLEVGSAETAYQSLYELGKVGTNSKVLEGKGRAPAMPSLEPEEILLTYHVTADETHLFAQTGALVQHYWLGVSELELRDQVHALNSTLRLQPGSGEASAERTARLKAQSHASSQQLIPAAVADLLREHVKLTVCGADQLDRVAFEALSSVSEEHDFLGLTHEITYLPSLPLRSQLAGIGQVERSYSLLGGARDMGLDAEWGQRLAQYYDESNVLEGAASNPDVLRDASVSVLQIFGHGVQRYQREMITSITLDGGDLTFEAIMQMKQPPLLGVLTACRGWTGPSRAGDSGAGNLAAAFFQLGTPTVIVSDADVSIDGSYAWSSAFHRSLISGASPARAALEARRELALYADSSDPFCGFLLHVVGVGHAPLFASADRPLPIEKAPAERGPDQWRFYLAGAGLLLLLTYAVRRSRLNHQ